MALIAGSLAFIALALLLIPMQFDAPAHVATRSTPASLDVPTQRTWSAAWPAPSAVPGVPSLPRDSARVVPVAQLTPAPVPISVPTPAPDDEPSSAPSRPDFRANLADRGDRPLAPPRPLRQGE